MRTGYKWNIRLALNGQRPKGKLLPINVRKKEEEYSLCMNRMEWEKRIASHPKSYWRLVCSLKLRKLWALSERNIGWSSISSSNKYTKKGKKYCQHTIFFFLSSRINWMGKMKTKFNVFTVHLSFPAKCIQYVMGQML